MTQPAFFSSAATPGRPRRRRRRVMLVFLILVLVTGSVAVYFLRSLSSELDDAIAKLDRLDPAWRMEDIEASRKAVPAAKNSALHIMAITKLPSGMTVSLPFDKLPPQAQLTEQQADLLAKRLEVLKTAVAMARELKDMPDGRHPFEPYDPAVPRFRRLGVRDLCLLLKWDAALRAHAADAGGALESCLALQHAARSFGDQPELMAQLVRSAGNVIGVAAIERTLAQNDFTAASEPALKRLQTVLAGELDEPTMVFAMRGERAGIHQLLQAYEEGKIDQKFMAGTFEEILASRVPGYLARQRAALLLWQTDFIEALKLPQAETEQRLPALKKRAENAPTLARGMVYVMGLRQENLQTQAKLGCAVTALAAERFRLAHHRWPETLDVLVKTGFLAASLADPFDGKPLRLKRVADGLIIYSVGRDQSDNGGNIDRQRPAAAGADVGVQLWDPRYRRQAAD
jgi:hypothetical protein